LERSACQQVNAKIACLDTSYLKLQKSNSSASNVYLLRKPSVMEVIKFTPRQGIGGLQSFQTISSLAETTKPALVKTIKSRTCLVLAGQATKAIYARTAALDTLELGPHINARSAQVNQTTD
jgi:hypothetical protein